MSRASISFFASALALASARDLLEMTMSGVVILAAAAGLVVALGVDRFVVGDSCVAGLGVGVCVISVASSPATGAALAAGPAGAAAASPPAARARLLR